MGGLTPQSQQQGCKTSKNSYINYEQINSKKENIMAARKKLSRKGAGRLFKATASRTHRFNVNKRPMRGGTRL